MADEKTRQNVLDMTAPLPDIDGAGRIIGYHTFEPKWTPHGIEYSSGYAINPTGYQPSGCVNTKPAEDACAGACLVRAIDEVTFEIEPIGDHPSGVINVSADEIRTAARALKLAKKMKK